MKSEEIDQLITYRLEQAEVSLEDARFLLNGNRSPQSIVNRSYYAMFYASLALLQKISKIPSKHSGVISLFDTEYVLKGIFSKKFSKDFHKAFEVRQTADYKVIDPVTTEKAKKILYKAERFVNAVKQFFSRTG